MSVKIDKIWVIDLEATCWENQPDFQAENSEIIEIGQSWLYNNGVIERVTPRLFIKPVKYPILTDYCKKLTGIKQEQVDNAPTLNQVLPSLLKTGIIHRPWAGWGNYDGRQLCQEAKDKNIPFMFNYNYINIKLLHALCMKQNPQGLGKAINSLGLSFIGDPHNGSDDSYNAARVMRWDLYRKFDNANTS